MPPRKKEILIVKIEGRSIRQMSRMCFHFFAFEWQDSIFGRFTAVLCLNLCLPACLPACFRSRVLAPIGGGEQNTGVIYGITSACSAVMGSTGTYLTGVVLDTTDSWVLVFKVSWGGRLRAETRRVCL